MTRLLLAALLLMATVSYAGSRLVDRVRESVPEGLRISAMTCRGSVVKLRGDTPNNARLSAFMRAMNERGIHSELVMVLKKNDVEPAVSVFVLHARDTANPRLDPCVGLPGRYAVPGAPVVPGSFRDACPGTPSPLHILSTRGTDDIRMIGVMSRSGGALLAVVKAEDSEVQRVRVGDRLGAAGACVTKITEGGMTFRISGNPPEVRNIRLTPD